MATDRVTVTVRVENSYATGDVHTHDLTVAVPAPSAGEHLGDWAADNLLAFTGQGPAFAGIEALYEVTVMHCGQRPDLIGITVSSQG